jgi:CheY-like chemotaxis protein
MRIIKASIEGQLAGKAAFMWPSDGVRCSITVPYQTAVLGPGANESPAKKESEGREVPSEGAKICANTVMVMEDEALVAMAISSSLAKLGISVIGPFSRMAEALIALKEAQVDAAILDVNLGGELIYPLADALLAAQTPFVFVTGYGREGVDPRFANIPVLEKPIEHDLLTSMFSSVSFTSSQTLARAV